MKENLAHALVPAADTRTLLDEIVSACGEAKASNLVVLDVSRQLDLTRYFIIASGRSDRQVQGIGNRILHAMEQRGISPGSIEGMEEAHWVLLDFDDIVVHVFYEPTRAHYDLEGLWKQSPRLALRTGEDPRLSAVKAA